MAARRDRADGLGRNISGLESLRSLVRPYQNRERRTYAPGQLELPVRLLADPERVSDLFLSEAMALAANPAGRDFVSLPDRHEEPARQRFARLIQGVLNRLAFR